MLRPGWQEMALSEARMQQECTNTRVWAMHGLTCTHTPGHVTFSAPQTAHICLLISESTRSRKTAANQRAFVMKMTQGLSITLNVKWKKWLSLPLNGTNLAKGAPPWMLGIQAAAAIQNKATAETPKSWPQGTRTPMGSC